MEATTRGAGPFEKADISLGGPIGACSNISKPPSEKGTRRMYGARHRQYLHSRALQAFSRRDQIIADRAPEPLWQVHNNESGGGPGSLPNRRHTVQAVDIGSNYRTRTDSRANTTPADTTDRPKWSTRYRTAPTTRRSPHRIPWHSAKTADRRPPPAPRRAPRARPQYPEPPAPAPHRIPGHRISLRPHPLLS